MFWSKKPLVVTHSARFHADDLFATAIILEHLGGNARVVRSVDEEVIRGADYVLDIGREYDPGRNRFDHHQGGIEKRPNGISYAAAGLVWKHLGEKVAGNRKAADYIDNKLIAQIDVIDNGEADVKPLAADVYPYFLDDMAKVFGSTWLENDSDFDSGFMYLLPLARSLLKREIVHAKAKIAAEEMIDKTYESAEDKRIIVIDAFYPPLDRLIQKDEPLFAICPDRRSKGSWAILAVRKNIREYGNRKDFPKEWAGLSGENLARVSGVPDATFCHLGRFLAVAKSKEGAIALAKKAIDA